MSATINEVRERPILFSGEMVRAILDGRKSHTRRVVKFPRAIEAIEGGAVLVAFDRMQPGYRDGSTRAVFDFDGEPNSFSVRCPYGSAGDRLWVREALERGNWTDGRIERTDAVFYRADGDYALDAYQPATWAWQRDILPSQFCPRGLSRITLEVTGVRVERVQDISEADAKAEGVEPDTSDLARYTPHVSAYAYLWQTLNGARGYGWPSNPWVWVIEFRRIDPSAAVSLPGDEP